MEVRSYYASTVEAAMEMARQELGPEALLIQAKRSAREVEHLGGYEVLFAGEVQAKRQERVEPPPARTDLVLRATSGSRRAVIAAREADEVYGLHPVDLVGSQTDFSAILAAAGVAKDSSREFFNGKPIVKQLEKQLPIARAVAHDFACSPGLGRTGFTETAVAFVGPAGAGKTTSVMKLALMHGVLMSRAVRLFSFDPDRIGTGTRLQRFAELLHLRFEEFETVPELSNAIEKTADGLTLIDTAGYGSDDAVALTATATCLLQHPKVETQLILKVDRKTADNLIAIRLFSAFQPARLILTGLDASSDNAGLADLIGTAQLPVSFLGVGQRIPEDMEPARSERVAELISNGWPESARSAA